MNALGITPYFDGIFISSEQGCKKPDLAFYESLLTAFAIPRKTAVMTGNDGLCDIEGAKRAGACHGLRADRDFARGAIPRGGSRPGEDGHEKAQGYPPWIEEIPEKKNRRGK